MTIDPIQASGLASAQPPRERILAAAADLFYRHGIRAVGVDAVAEAAGTNKMTLYRHFVSKDELVAACLRRFAADAETYWDGLEAAHPGDPLAQLHAWLEKAGEHINNPKARGCALANAAVELPEKDHPARAVIEDYKRAQRQHLARLCRLEDFAQPELLADELFLMLEGARVCAQSMGSEGPACRMVHAGRSLIATHPRLSERRATQ